MRFGRMGLRSAVVLGRRRGFDWYVDSVNGDDGNSGKKPGEALQTIGELTSRGIAAGKKIGLARGSHWREQLTIPADYVRVEAYGTGSRPLLDASDVIANVGFSKTAGRTNIYEISLSPDIPTVDPFIGFWEDDVWLTRVTSLDTCDTTAGSYYIASDAGPAPVTIYFHPAASDDPITNGKTYECSMRWSGLWAEERSYTTIVGIHARRSIHGSGSIKIGPWSTAINCRASEGGKHNFFVSRNCAVINCEADEAQYTPGQTASLFIFYSASSDGTEIATFEGCRVWQTTYYSLYTAYYGHGGSLKWGRVTFRDCRAENMGGGFNGDAEVFIAERCVCDNQCNFGFRLVSSKVKYVTLTDCAYLNGRDNGIGVELTNSLLETITIRGMTLRGNTRIQNGFIYLTRAAALDVRDTTFELLTPNMGTAPRGVSVWNDGASLVARNLRMIAGIDLAIDCSSYNPTLDSDYNAYMAVQRFRKGGTIYANLAAWQAATGQDLNSTSG